MIISILTTTIWITVSFVCYDNNFCLGLNRVGLTHGVRIWDRNHYVFFSGN